MGRTFISATLSFLFIIAGLAGCSSDTKTKVTDITGIAGEKEASAAERPDYPARPDGQGTDIKSPGVRFQVQSTGSFEYRPSGDEYLGSHLSTIKLEPQAVFKSGG